MDEFLHNWRLCFKCAHKTLGGDIEPYEFDESAYLCGKKIRFILTISFMKYIRIFIIMKKKMKNIVLEDEQGSLKRAICECDLDLAVKLRAVQPQSENIDFDGDNCLSYMKKGQGRCCLKENGLYSWHPDWMGCPTE